jgi:putative pyruvate formate lyase activating enzyme
MSALSSYLLLSEQSWQEKIDKAFSLANPCRLCPRNCMVNRLAGEKGYCKAPGELFISSIFPHHGEEPPVSGTGGSGTVFLSFCTLRCIFCQNFQISSAGEGERYSHEQLADRMVWLQEQGCHNINVVTGSHYLPWFLQALHLAVPKGLTIPVVYNCSGYESVEALDILNSIVDIYLPDMKYGDDESGRKYSSVPDYVEVNRVAIKTMFKQVGPLKVDRNGIARRGLIIRHLVLPNNRSHSQSIARYLARTYDPADIFISLMAQYRPLHRANDYPEIARGITVDEYEPIKQLFINLGFEGFFQEADKMDISFVIDFKKRKSERLTGEDLQISSD